MAEKMTTDLPYEVEITLSADDILSAMKITDAIIVMVAQDPGTQVEKAFTFRKKTW